MAGAELMARAVRFSSQGWEDVEIECPDEASVELHVNGKYWVTWQCLPQELEALAAGFLFNEGIIHSKDEIHLLEVSPDRRMVDVWLAHAADQPDSKRLTSGCGGGQSSLKPPPPLPEMTALEAHTLLWMIGDFLEYAQKQRIPGTHISALYWPAQDGARAISVDIGRHNTLDKLAGRCLLDERASAGCVLLSSGRISADMLQKAARLGAPWGVSLRSATGLALRLGQDWNICVVSHARRGGFEVLTHPERLTA